MANRKFWQIADIRQNFNAKRSKKMKKIIALVVLAVMCVFTLAACGPTQSGNDLFILTYKLADPNMSGLWQPGFEDAAAELGYNKPSMSDSNGDNNNGLQLVEQAALKPYAAYLLNIVDQTNAETYLSKVQGTGKPVIFWNRLPDPADTLKKYDKAYYVGIEAAEGGRYQGQMAAEYVNKTGFETLDRNGDGKLGVIVVRGEKGHPDAEDRTLYSPMYLERNLTGGNAEASGTVSDTVYTTTNTWNKVEVLAIVDGTDTAGTTWEPVTAKNEVERVLNEKGDEVDLVLSNNDGMALTIITGDNFKAAGIPIWGVDALDDALTEIKKADTQLKGTVKNDGKSQAKVCVQIAKNLSDGKDVAEGLTVVSTKAEWEANSNAIWYDSTTKCFFVHHSMITAANA